MSEEFEDALAYLTWRPRSRRSVWRQRDHIARSTMTNDSGRAEMLKDARETWERRSDLKAVAAIMARQGWGVADLAEAMQDEAIIGELESHVSTGLVSEIEVELLVHSSGAWGTYSVLQVRLDDYTGEQAKLMTAEALRVRYGR